MDNFPYYSSDQKLFSKKNIISFLILGILILTIPLAVRLVQTQQILKSRASTGKEIQFPDLSKRDAQGNFVTSDPNIKVLLESPYGPPTSPTQTQ